MKAKKIKGIFINCIIVLAAIFIALATAEMMLRLLFIKPDQGVGHNKLFCEYDPILGWRKIPNAKGLRVFKEGARERFIFERFNSKGNRGPEYPYEKDGSEYRILVLGDSFAEGYGVKFSELFSEILKAELNRKGRRDKYYQVINSGTEGWSTDQELLFFQQEGKRYKPDIVVLMFYDNDVWFNNQPRYWRRYKPFFKFEEGELRLANVPVPRQGTTDSGLCNAQGGERFLKKVKRWLCQRTYLYNLVIDRIKNIHWLHLFALKLGLVDEPDSTKMAPEEAEAGAMGLVPEEYKVWQRVYSNEIRDAWRITEAIIIKLREECNSIGSKLVVFFVPDRASIYTEEWQDTKRKYGINDKDWNINQAGIELESICSRNKIDFINPYKAFIIEFNELKKDSKRLYFIYDRHWNAQGHRFVGEMLADYITFKYLGNNK